MNDPFERLREGLTSPPLPTPPSCWTPPMLNPLEESHSPLRPTRRLCPLLDLPPIFFMKYVLPYSFIRHFNSSFLLVIVIRGPQLAPTTLHPSLLPSTRQTL